MLCLGFKKCNQIKISRHFCHSPYPWKSNENSKINSLTMGVAVCPNQKISLLTNHFTFVIFKELF